MSELYITLSDPEAISRFREIATAVLISHGEIRDDMRTLLQERAAEIGVHPSDVQFVLSSIRKTSEYRTRATSKRRDKERERERKRHLERQQQELASSHAHIAMLEAALRERESRVQQAKARLQEMEASLSEAWSASFELPLVVSRQGSGFRTISDALQAGGSGARIVVHPGVYQERIIIRHPVEIVGLGPRREIVVESENGCPVASAPAARVRGLTFLLGGNPSPTTKLHTVETWAGRLTLEDYSIYGGALDPVVVRGPSTRTILHRCSVRGGQNCGVLVYGRAGRIRG